MARSVDRLTQRVDNYTASITPSAADLRQQVRELAAGQWHEPVVVVHLNEVKPEFDVPGRRKDGTVKGKRLIRRFFWNILRGGYAAVLNVVMLVMAGGMGNVLRRDGTVTGPADAQALGLLDAARPAKDAWLAYSGSHAAVIDSGRILWHTDKPPTIARTKGHITWPDGSTFTYKITADEAEVLRQERKARLRDGHQATD